MIRRWSYLNYINKPFYETNLSLQTELVSGYLYGTFKATTFYWGDLSPWTETFIRRRKLFQRRRKSNLLAYQNILNSWALDYLFTRRCIKSILNLYLHKNNYVYSNLFHITRLDASGSPHLNILSSSFVSRRVRLFLSNFNKLFLPSSGFFQAPVLYVSSDTPLQIFQSDDLPIEDEVKYRVIGNSLFSVENQHLSRIPYNQILAILLNLSITVSVSNYKLLTLLTLNSQHI